MQNLPSRGDIGKEARSLFIPRDGHKLIVADYESMEMVIATHYSQDPILTGVFSQGLDVHATTACGTWNIPYDQFMEEYGNGNLEYDRMRRVAKVLNFGQAYGMGAQKLQRTLLVEANQEFNYEECKEFIKQFHLTYEGLADWKKKVSEFAGEKGFVPTILGRKRRLPLVFSADKQIRSRSMRQAVNAVIQGSCADILFQAMVPIQASFKAMRGSLVASVHDELVGEVPEEFALAAKHSMENLMVDLINPQLRVKLKAEAHVGSTWYGAKKGI